MHRQAFGYRDRHDDKIAAHQMAHHVGDPLAPVEGIVARLDLTRRLTHPAVKRNAKLASHDAGVREVPRDQAKRLTLFNRNLARRRKFFGWTEPVVRQPA